MLTRKHFQAFGDEIRRIEDPAQRQQAFWTVASVAARFNPNFDRERFRKACGVPE
jgi:hypothetical protein